MATAFGNINVSFLWIFPQISDNATDERYCGILDRLQQAIRRKRPEFMRQNFIIITTKPVVLPLTGLALTTALRLGGCGSHSSNPDFALSDCHFFEIVTNRLVGKTFAIDDVIKQGLSSWLQTFAIYFFYTEMEALILWQNRRLNISDDYTEL
jgi:hypothetical protein